MAVFKHFVILALAIFTVSIHAQLRGSNTETPADNAVASIDEATSDTVSITGTEPVAVDLETAEGSPIVDSENAGDVGVNSLEIDSTDPEIDLLNTGAGEVVGFGDAGVDTESADLTALEGSVDAEAAAEDVAIENGSNAEEFVGLADAGLVDDIEFADLAVDPEMGLADASLLVEESADPLVMDDPNVNNDDEALGMELANDVEEFVDWAEPSAVDNETSFAEDIITPSTDAVAMPETAVADAGFTNEESSDLFDMADAVAAIEGEATVMESIDNGEDLIGLGDAIAMDGLITEVEADPELTEASLSVSEELALPNDVAELDVTEDTRDALTEAANADFASAMEELAREADVEGLALIDNGVSDVQENVDSTTEIETPTADEVAATLGGFGALEDVVTGSVPESIASAELPTETTVNDEELAVEAPEFTAETSLPTASIGEAETPEVMGEDVEFNADMVGFESAATEAADAADIIDVPEETNELTEAINAELASLATAVDEKLDSVAASLTDAGMEAAVVAGEAATAADDTINELGRVIDSVTVPSGFQSFIDETREAQPVDVAPVMETIMSGSQAIATPLAEVTGSNSLEAIVAKESAAEASNEPEVTSDAVATVADEAEVVLVNYSEDSEGHDHESNDHESHVHSEEEMEAMQPHTSAAMHSYPSILTLLVVALTTAGVFF